jgi:acetyl esterase/lipase
MKSPKEWFRPAGKLRNLHSVGVIAAVVLVVAGGVALGLALTSGRSTPSAGVGAGASHGSTSIPTTPATTAPTTPPTSATAPATSSTTTSTTSGTVTPSPYRPAATTTTTTTTTSTTNTSPRPFGLLTCHAEYGVRFCPGGLVGGGRNLRVPSFDGVPLDADVTLPARGSGPFPLLVLLHGWGQTKTAFESTSDDGQLDNVTMASRGWAVLTYTARGFGDSCGTAASRAGTPACAKGWIHLADQRYEIRDTEYLAGRLVDEGLARPDFAVAGVSYGGGQSLELAMLKNRMELPDGKLVPLTSPRRHIPMSVAAVYAEWPWDDLVSALTPNGHLSSSTYTPPRSDLDPVGVGKQSWLSLLYAASGYLAPPGADPQANITAWYREFQAGEPYSAKARRALEIIQRYKSAIGIPMASGGPAPTAIASGWTDSLFPASEAMHYANRLRADGEHTPLLLMLGDIGHGWAQNEPSVTDAMTARGVAFLEDAVQTHRAPPTGVDVTPTVCPGTAAETPTLSGPALSALQSGSVRFTGTTPQVVTSSGGSAATAAALDPSYAGPLCHALPANKEPGTAVYTRPVGTTPTTLLGAPTITADITVTGNYPELVGRLWDVAPGSTSRQIVAMGIFRPSVNQKPGTSSHATATERISFELNPDDYTFAPSHTMELELVGSNAPYFRKSNGTFSVKVHDLQVTLPTR